VAPVYVDGQKTVTRTGLTTYINGGTFNDTRMRETIGLALSSNAFQWY
jgi:hypothetical protein